MKKVLSLLLAVLMVIGICPTFLLSSLAANGDGSDSGTEAETFPELVITEIYANAINYCQNAAAWLKNWPAEVGFYSAPQPGEPYYLSLKEYAVGATLPNNTYKKVVDENGVVSFTLLSNGSKAVAGESYFFRYDTAKYYDSFQYMEVYNSGTKPINLYDYKLTYDSSSTYNEQRHTSNPVRINEIKPGAVKSSYRRDGFERIALEVGTPLDGYYTKNGETFVPCAENATAETGVEYYQTFGEDGTYFVTNPDTAILQPGQCAVLWFYTDIDQICGAKMSYFRQFFEYETANKAYHLDMSDTMVLCVDSNDLKDLSGFALDTSVGFNIVLGNHVRYGIVGKDYTNTIDNSYNNWISSVRWDAYAGFNESLAVSRASVVPGVTVVTNTSGTVYFYKDEQSGYYLIPKVGTAEQLAAGTASADANGKAIDGMEYYTINLAKTNNAPSGSNSPVSHKLDRTSTNFLYGFDSDLAPKEGAAYTVSSFDVTPGMLTEAQRATLPNGKQKTSAPRLVITEVMPDCKGADLFEYVEVVNTSGQTINIFDYTFVARSSSYMACSNEFFNKANPLIPGDVGNILSAEPGYVYNDVVPTNIEYKNGWLEPGETVLLWSYFSDSAIAGATFDDFYNYYNLDRSVKVIAMDADNTSYSGRALRQNLGNSGSYLYGLVANADLDFYGEVYKSNPVMKPIVFGNGVSSVNHVGIPISDCESFVVAANVFATGSSVPGLGENVGYQYIWNKNPGVNNKCGAYYSYARLTQMSNDYRFCFTGSVVTEEWKASPGQLLPRQKTALTKNTGSERYVLYMQDFEGLGTVSGADAVAKLLGLATFEESENRFLGENHNYNVADTEKDGESFFEIKNGKLYIKNNGSFDDYVKLMSDDIFKSYRKTNFTIEYSMTYSADSVDGCNGYSAILFHFDGAKMSYAAPVIRISGYGSNSVYLNGTQMSVEDAPDTAHGAPSMSAKSGSGTLYEKLTGKEASGNLQGGEALAEVTLNVRIEVSYTNGVTVYVNDKEVSETKQVASSEVFANWAYFLEESEGTDLVLKTTPGVSVAYDYIMVYSDTLGTNASDMDIPSLYITEVLLDGGTKIYTPNTTATTGLGWLEYIEVTNGGDQPVSLMDYTLLRNSCSLEGGRTITYSHLGNNRTWDPLDGDRVARFADWLGKGDQKTKIYCDKDPNAYVMNPSENEAVLQPGESIVVLTLNEGGTADCYTKPDAKGKTVDTISAARSWLQLPDNTKIMVIGQASNIYKQVGDEAPVNLPRAFAMWNSESFTYGIGRNTGTYYDGTTYELGIEDWKNIYTHDYRKIESLMDLNLSVTFGQNNSSVNGDDYGTGGRSVSGDGWVAYYLYGNDNSAHYKFGVAMSRRQGRVFTTYKSGTAAVDAQGDYNAGKLLAAQQKSFEELCKLKNNGYEKDASLVITEYIPGTTDDRGGGRNSFESVEITNIGTTPVNLYQYALTQSPTTYGCTGTWNTMNPMMAGTPAGKNHKWYDRLQYIENPEECIVKPGESVVVWVYYNDAYVLADVAPKRDYVSVEDFRNFWESQGNPVINQYEMVEKTVTDANGNPVLDANGNPVTETVKEYKVKVVTVVGNDGGITPSFNLVNNGAVSIGICRKSTVSVNASVRAADVLSYTTNPLHSVVFDLRVRRVPITKSTYPYLNSTTLTNWANEEAELVTFGEIINAGDSVKGYYISDNCRDFTLCGDTDVAEKGKYYYELQEDGTFLPIPVNENISVADYFIKTGNKAYTRATGTHAGRTYTAVGVMPGDSTYGLFVKTPMDIYTQCAAGAIAVAGTTYYAYADGVYAEVAVKTGSLTEGLYTKSETTEYRQCAENAVAEEGVTYYQKNEDGTYTAVTEIVVGETVVSAYYTMVTVDVYTPCAAGIVTAGVTYYRKDGDNYTVAEVELPDDVSAYFTKTVEERILRCAKDEVAKEGKTYYSAEYQEYYRLYFYANVQTMSGNDNGLNQAFNFVYGTSASGSWSIGSVLQTTKVTKRDRGSENRSSETPNFVPEIILDIASVGSRQNTLGYLIEEQLGMLASVNFTEAASLADGTKVYLYKTVKKDLPDVAVNMLGASVDRTEEGTTVSFSATIEEEVLRALEARFGAENVSVGMITARVDTLLATGANLRAFELAGAYVPATGLSAVTVLNSNNFVKSYRDAYEKCAEGTLAVAGVTYYAQEGDEYVPVENVNTGTDLNGLYVKELVDRYIRCGIYDEFDENETYYELVDRTYVKVTGITADTYLGDYFTRSQKEVYTAVSGVAVAGVTYYEKNEIGEYVEAVVELPEDVSAYYVIVKKAEYTPCEDGAYAEPGVTYYTENADGTYTAMPKAKTVSRVAGYYVKNGEVYVACEENAIAVAGVTYYEKVGEEYVAVTGLKTVDLANGLYVLENGVYTRCEDGEYVLTGKTYYTPANFRVDENLVGVKVENGKLRFTGSALTMSSDYYKDTYTAIAYIKVRHDGQDIYFYATKAVSRSAVQVLYSAMLDVSDVRTDEYCYEVGDGTYSRYTAAQRKQFEKLCNAAAEE